jgi:hypothetical protein
VTYGVTVNAEPESSRGSPLGLPEDGVADRAGGVERWLEMRLNLLAYGIVTIAFLLRAYAAGSTFLNPDEALHYIILNQRSVYWAYKISLTNAHPPLIYFLLYYWKFLGRSEMILRFPSVVAGTATCWVAYKWIGTLFGKVAGLVGLVLFAFSPAMIALSAEVRSYELLLVCETAALYFAEAALREKSVPKMWCFSAFQYLAILSHYSAIFFSFAIGVYVTARMLEDRPPRAVVLAWASAQAGVLAICGFLYVTHVSKLKSYVSAWEVSFDKSFSHTGHEHLLTYAGERTLDIFKFLFENHYVAIAMLLLWMAGIVILLLGNWVTRQKNQRFFLMGILLSVPVLAVFGAGVAGYYPYVGSRHTAFLAPFVIAALSFVLAKASRQKIGAAFVIAGLLVAAANISGQVFEPYIARENQSRTLMKAALDHIHETIPPGGLIVTDYQSALLLVYYLCGPELILPTGTFNLPASRVKCNGYTIASYQTWEMHAPLFLSDFAKIAKAQRLTPGVNIWVFQSGWGPTLAQELPSSSPRLGCVSPKIFGANISVIPLRVGPDFSPIAAVAECP